MIGRRRQAPRPTWWTRERVIGGLKRFYREQGLVPTSSEAWHDLTATPHGSSAGYRRRPYPSIYAVGLHFASMRDAWTAAGVDVDRGWEPWSEIEDWYLREGAGVLTRTVLAADLNRTPDAVHRRMYDIGVHSYERWGWTLNRLERTTGIQRHTWQRYMDWGDLPYFQGSKCTYVDPGDLTVVSELDLSALPVELEEAMLRSLRQRLVKILAGVDWRAGRVHQTHQVLGLSRIHNRRCRSPARPSPKPFALERGDWVRVVGEMPTRPHTLGRVGLVHFVYWAHARSGNDLRSDSAGAWMARVEFKSQHNRSRGPRVTYSIPLHLLAHVAAPGRTGNTTTVCGCGAIIVCGWDESPPTRCAFCGRGLALVRTA